MIAQRIKLFESEPAVFKAVLVLIGILLFWTFCFIGGVLLDLGGTPGQSDRFFSD